ncbi:hypothetical protein [Singulisphaera acidiphila]|uniref:Uncharacterized protein n=1 Tax=Singulisphaera acidiphila (strain ATCC BAA-1392 / DSM 18658 / VKM B-2454 / MOB10) TaxID=886293 RepID=L0DF82_SINAD|nr:hypothetical protein [Singulisphaera acidiphila]AGA28039.1 hypothetical protein Sinac_3806 [Singulisphaera acidiphila DSM 18658]
MIRGNLKANLFSAFCLAAFAVALSAAPTQAGRSVTLAEADNVQGAACSGPASTMSAWCSIECTWLCFSTGCTSCGCPQTADIGTSGIYTFYTEPCGVAGCGSKPSYLGPCTGS